MILSERLMKSYFLEEDFLCGKRYFKEGKVCGLKKEADGEKIKIRAAVKDESGEHSAEIRMAGARISCVCDCWRYKRGYLCGHIAAVMLEYIYNYQGGVLMRPVSGPNTNYFGSQLLKHYMQRAAEPQTDTMHIGIGINVSGKGYPEFYFSVGSDRMYVVNDAREFAGAVYGRKVYSYGKNLTFCHAIENFDPQAAQFIRILLNQFPEFRTDASETCGGEYYYRPGRGKRYVRFEGNSFERVYDLLKSEEGKKRWSELGYEFGDGDPEISLELKSSGAGAVLLVRDTEGISFFGNEYDLYCVSDSWIMRCSAAFRDKIYPIIKTCSGIGGIFGETDLPTLCGSVLSKVKDIVSIRDDECLMEQYTPDECTACYYLDRSEEFGLVARIKYRYGERVFDENSAPKDYLGVKRNIGLEQELRRPLLRDFTPDEARSRFYISDSDKAAEFMSDGIEELHKCGEVYISDDLDRKRVRLSREPALGISVSDGVLTLTFDTGGFPPEELEALYGSMVRRKKYHRLADGRYLPLDGEDIGKIAEIAHMVQLDENQLRKGEAVMPAARGLYLDRVLENSGALSVIRNDSFRRLVRDFKSVEDGDYIVPDSFSGQLRPYQRTGFQWLKTLEANSFGGILADEMGLGKTIQILAFLLTADRKEKGAPSLIVCPSSLILNWYDEMKKFAPSLVPLLIMGGSAERRAQLESGAWGEADVCITSYDLLKRDLKLYEGKEFYCCILDEGQYIKNRSTLASKAVKSIACRQRFVLTGTPIENRLSELWNLFDFLMPGYLFSNAAFVKKLEKPIIVSGDEKARRQLSLLVRPFMLRRLKADVLKELPPKIEHVRRIQMSEGERRLYEAEKHIARAEAEKTREKFKILALLMHLRQICCDPALCFENYNGESSKLDACVELCVSQIENGHQILLFSQFTSMLDRIRERLDNAGILNYTIEGSTPKPERARLVKAFAKGGADVFLISLKAGGTGLNLTSADVIIHYDPWWNAAAQNQATDRAHRIGQLRSVQVYKLIAADSVEEKILRLQEKKAGLMDMVAAERPGEPLTREEILELLD